MQVLPNATVGAEVRGVDLARAGAQEIAGIKQAWYRHDVLVFRGQKLSDEQWNLLAFYSWDTDEQQVMPNAELGKRLGDLAAPARRPRARRPGARAPHAGCRGRCPRPARSACLRGAQTPSRRAAPAGAG